MFYKNKVHFVDTLSRKTYVWVTAVLCGSENSHNVVQLNPDGDNTIYSHHIQVIEQIIEQPHTTNFQSRKNHFFRPR